MFEGLIPGLPPKNYPADKARGGVIILRHNWQRIVFFSGLFGGVVLLVLFAAFGSW